MKLTIAVLLMTTTLGLGQMVFADSHGPFQSTGANPENSTVLGADPTLMGEDEDFGDEDIEDGEFDGDYGGDSEEGHGGGYCDDDGEGDDNEGGDDCTDEAAGDAAKAGIVAPPKNGLFTDGTAPTVKSN